MAIELNHKGLGMAIELNHKGLGMATELNHKPWDGYRTQPNGGALGGLELNHKGLGMARTQPGRN